MKPVLTLTVILALVGNNDEDHRQSHDGERPFALRLSDDTALDLGFGALCSLGVAFGVGLPLLISGHH